MCSNETSHMPYSFFITIACVSENFLFLLSSIFDKNKTLFRAVIKGRNSYTVPPITAEYDWLFPLCYGWNYLLLIEFQHEVTCLLWVWWNKATAESKLNDSSVIINRSFFTFLADFTVHVWKWTVLKYCNDFVFLWKVSWVGIFFLPQNRQPNNQNWNK